MKMKIIIASIIIVAALAFGAMSFVESNIEYTGFQTAISTQKKVQVKGEWLRDQSSSFNSVTGQFVFFMKDERGVEMKVVFDGARPNNFELADAVVVKGRFRSDHFHATEILTKCPSKYEADAETVKKSL